MKKLLYATLAIAALAWAGTANAQYREVAAPPGATCASAQQTCDKGCAMMKATTNPNANCSACIERFRYCRETGKWQWDYNQTTWVGVPQ